MTMRGVMTAGMIALAFPVLADEAEDIKARLDAFETALNGGDAAGVAALYTEDAMVLPPDGEMAEGRDAIQEVWQGAIDAGLTDVELQPMEIEVVEDTAYETSTFSGMLEDAPAKGKYIVVWKNVDDQWYLHRDIWNMSPAE